MDEREFNDELDPDDVELFVDVYDLWLLSEEYIVLMVQRQREQQYRLDNGEWDTDDEYTLLADALENVTAFLKSRGIKGEESYEYAYDINDEGQLRRVGGIAEE